MPKKFKGENTKAQEAKARKAAKVTEETERKKQAEEDAFWEDDDKHIKRKQDRLAEREKKKQEQLERKQELKKLADEEMANMKSKSAAGKVTQADIAAYQAKVKAEKEEQLAKKELMHDEVPLEENVNRLEADGESARDVTEAIQVLSVSEDAAPAVDKHPERRVKAAYAAFEERRLPELKAENPNMRLSQVKQLLKKEWIKCPGNPMNQRLAAYNTKT